jgi:hypothetical protein
MGLDQDEKPDGKYSAISDVQGFLCGTIMATSAAELWRLIPSYNNILFAWLASKDSFWTCALYD